MMKPTNSKLITTIHLPKSKQIETLSPEKLPTTETTQIVHPQLEINVLSQEKEIKSKTV